MRYKFVSGVGGWEVSTSPRRTGGSVAFTKGCDGVFLQPSDTLLTIYQTGASNNFVTAFSITYSGSWISVGTVTVPVSFSPTNPSSCIAARVSICGAAVSDAAMLTVQCDYCSTCTAATQQSMWAAYYSVTNGFISAPGRTDSTYLTSSSYSR
jgi:hypothetical protein